MPIATADWTMICRHGLAVTIKRRARAPVLCSARRYAHRKSRAVGSDRERDGDLTSAIGLECCGFGCTAPLGFSGAAVSCEDEDASTRFLLDLDGLPGGFARFGGLNASTFSSSNCFRFGTRWLARRLCLLFALEPLLSSPLEGGSDSGPPAPRNAGAKSVDPCSAGCTSTEGWAGARGAVEPAAAGTGAGVGVGVGAGARTDADAGADAGAGAGACAASTGAVVDAAAAPVAATLLAASWA
jgi:hypothetical protein